MGARDTEDLDGTALRALAAQALERLTRQGFEQAQASASVSMLTELNLELDRPTLLRQTRTRRLALVGIQAGRRATTDLSDGAEAALDAAVQALWHDAQGAPVDEAHQVSQGQVATLRSGPPVADPARLADSVAQLLDWRAAHTPQVTLRGGAAAHTRVRSCLLSSAGSAITSDIGSESLQAMFSARDGDQVSSFNYCGGHTHDLAARPAAEHFAIGALMRDAVRSVQARPLSRLGGAFEGPVVLAPAAAAALLQWLLGQLGDERLLSGTSLYRDQVGRPIAAPGLSLHSRFDAPGIAAVSSDGWLAPAVTLVDGGVLRSLTPGRHVSRKTGLTHVPVAPSGWQVPAGATPLSALVGGVRRGALVSRLSMGMPSANGEFSGVIKNSFLIEDGAVGPALAETMVSGNVARMLRDLEDRSAERVDYGDWCLPWLRVAGMRYS